MRLRLTWVVVVLLDLALFLSYLAVRNTRNRLSHALHNAPVTTTGEGATANAGVATSDRPRGSICS